MLARDRHDQRDVQWVGPWTASPSYLFADGFNAVIDFEAVVRDPADPTRMPPAYDVGDHLHPNDAGYRAMAYSIDLRLFMD